jgi:hypothetical protein
MTAAVLSQSLDFAMQPTMVRPRTQDKILRSIVRAIFVPVVQDLIPLQRSAEDSFSDEPVLSSILARADVYIPISELECSATFPLPVPWSRKRRARPEAGQLSRLFLGRQTRPTSPHAFTLRASILRILPKLLEGRAQTQTTGASSGGGFDRIRPSHRRTSLPSVIRAAGALLWRVGRPLRRRSV